MFKTKVGWRLRELRRKAGFTQEKLAEHTELSQTYVGRIERGETNLSVETLAKLVHVLGVSLPEFFDFMKASAYQTPENSLKFLVVDNTKGMEKFFNAICRNCDYFNSFICFEQTSYVTSFYNICCKSCKPRKSFKQYLASDRTGSGERELD